MNTAVKFSFTMIAYAIIALIFYYIFFGGIGITNVSDGSQYRGLIWDIADATLLVSAREFYNYTYEPLVHQSDEVDREVLDIVGQDTVTISALGSTPSNLDSLPSTSRGTFSYTAVSGSSGDNYFYTTGWH